MFSIPKDDTRPRIQTHQLLCNAENGIVIYCHIDKNNAAARDKLFLLGRADKSKLMVFQYETGPVGFHNLSEQIIKANLTTPQIVNVIQAAEKYGHYSKEDIQGLKDILEIKLDHKSDLMEWLANGSIRPEGDVVVPGTIASPAPV